jgi:kynurenine formamidase
MEFFFTHRGHHYVADTAKAIDLSIAIGFDEPSLQAFGAPAAQAHPMSAGSFIGDVNQHGSCNCSTYTLTPHCNGTHTECVGHLTHEALSVNSVAPKSLLFSALISVTPEAMTTDFAAADRVITASLLQSKLKGHEHFGAVIVRTLPNRDKKDIDYDQEGSPYFSEDALKWLASIEVDHLLCDLPSVDRMNDNGLLLAHRAFWGMPRGSNTLRDVERKHATITELIHVPDDVADGNYLLNLHVAPLNADASPSRPVLYPIKNAD